MGHRYIIKASYEVLLVKMIGKLCYNYIIYLHSKLIIQITYQKTTIKIETNLLI